MNTKHITALVLGLLIAAAPTASADPGPEDPNEPGDCFGSASHEKTGVYPAEGSGIEVVFSGDLRPLVEGSYGFGYSVDPTCLAQAIIEHITDP